MNEKLVFAAVMRDACACIHHGKSGRVYDFYLSALKITDLQIILSVTVKNAESRKV